VLETHIDRSEQLHSASELPADPPPHEEACEHETHDATQLIGQDDQESRDEESVSRAHTFGESQGATIC